MRILMLLERQFPFDERVEKEAISLIKAGHAVYILSFNFEKNSSYEEYKGIHVVRINISKKTFNRLNPLHRVVPFYKWLWYRHSKKILKKHDIDVVHVHDLPLANVGLKVKKKFGCKLVLDQHELWSETVKHYRHYNTVGGKIIRALSRWAAYEKKQFIYADKLITVEEPIKQWYVTRYGIDPKKIIVTSNTPIKKHIDDLNLIENKNVDKFVLYYAGKIDVNRYLETVIRALIPLSKKIPNILFNVAGNFARGCDPGALAKKYKVEEFVNYLGMLSYEDMMQNMKNADICISLLPSYSEELNRTIVTKVYQYLQLEKPMIVGGAKYIKRFVEEHNIGLVVDETSPDSVEKAIYKLYENRELLKEYSENAKVIKKHYVWENSILALLDYYEQLEKEI
jgi:glycosyltransferase involved in cell wall biosynthesis